MQRYIYMILGMVSLCMPVSAYGTATEDSDRMRYEAITLMDSKELFERASGFVQSTPDSALIYYDVLANRYSPTMVKSEARLCAEGLLASAVLFYDHFNYTRGMEELLKCRKISEDNDFLDLLSDTYRNIGNIYSVHEDFEHAIGFYKEALASSQSVGDSVRTHKALSNLVGANIFTGNLKSAVDYYTQMVANAIDDPMYGYDVLVDGALIEETRENKREALRLLLDASSYIEDKKLGHTQKGTVNSWLASTYLSLQRPDSALVYLKANEALARTTGMDDLLAETLRSLHEFYKQSGQRDKATEYLEEYLVLSDKVFNQKAFNTVKNTQFQWELDKSDSKIKNLTAERLRHQLHIKQQRAFIWIIISGLMALAIAVVIIYSHKIRLARAYSELYERNRSMLEKEKQLQARIRELQNAAERNAAEVKMSALAEDGVETAKAHVDQEDPAASDITPELKNRLLRDIERAMEKRELFCDPDFTINILADEIGSNSTYVSKVINKTYGINFRTFLNEYRIKESMVRMSDEDRYANYTITAIAESVGFRSQSSFIAAFTKFTGMKPSTYQQIARSKKS